jgi:anti-sigma B factor antagonist
MEGLTTKVEEKDGISIITCAGYIDSMTSPEIENALGELILKKKFKIIVDLEKVDYVSSAGWGIFVGHVKTARMNKGDIKFIKMKQEVREIFELLDFTNILEYYKDLDSAIKSFK